jgi:peptide-methionine (R)-S-oxide reductase
MTNRLQICAVLVLALGLGFGSACTDRGREQKGVSAMGQPHGKDADRKRVLSREEAQTRTDGQWREALTPEQYRVTRHKGTEAPFTGAYWDTRTPGVYRCVCCNVVLFRSDTKFDAGCGWPSFWEAATENVIREERDTTHGMIRTEVLCRNCDAHLGHVFDDGPRPTGLRYCINSASIKLEKRDGPATRDAAPESEPRE